jgi:hypothetical protein
MSAKDLVQHSLVCKHCETIIALGAPARPPARILEIVRRIDRLFAEVFVNSTVIVKLGGSYSTLESVDTGTPAQKLQALLDSIQSTGRARWP